MKVIHQRHCCVDEICRIYDKTHLRLYSFNIAREEIRAVSNSCWSPEEASIELRWESYWAPKVEVSQRDHRENHREVRPPIYLIHCAMREEQKNQIKEKRTWWGREVIFKPQTLFTNLF